MRVGSRIGLFETCSAFTRVPACLLAEPPKGWPFDISVPQPTSLPPWSALAASNRSDKGWVELEPTGTTPFHGALSFAGS